MTKEADRLNEESRARFAALRRQQDEEAAARAAAEQAQVPDCPPPPPPPVYEPYVAPHPTLAEQLSMRRGSLRRETSGLDQEEAGKRASMVALVEVTPPDAMSQTEEADDDAGSRSSSIWGVDHQAAAYPLPVAAEAEGAWEAVAEGDPTGEGVVVATREGTLVYH